MKDKYLVRNCIESLQNNKIEVSMKCRIGIGKELNYDFFEEFIDEVLKSGIKIIYVHARNAILSGLSPKANRNIPPLDYNFINKIKKKYPHITFILNGGINDFDKAINLSNLYDGVMVGRLIQNNPFLLKYVDHYFYNQKDIINIDERIIFSYFEFIKTKVEIDSIFRLLSPLLNIFFGIPESKSFKIQIHDFMKNKELNLIEKLLIKFVKEKKLLLN